MTIQAISNAAANVSSNVYKNTTVPKSLQNPTAPKEDAKSYANSPSALMNYFLGTKNVPSFKGYPCSTGEFVVKQINDVPCACCGDAMMNWKEQNSFVEKVTKTQGQELADTFKANLHKIRRNERPVAREIMERALQYPTTSLGGLVNKKDMDASELFNKENSIVLDKVSQKAKELYGEENKVSNFVESQKVLLNPSSRKSLRREEFLKNIQKITAGDDAEKTNKLLAEAIELPLNESGISKVISKVQTSDTTGIARRLISTAVMTTEHIHPKSLGGPNASDNYMGECAECNNNRGSENLNNYWQTFYPNMPDAVQKYNDYITDKIVQGEMGVKYEDYPLDLEKAVETESKGVIDLKVLNPEQIDKMRKEKGLADPKPLPEPVYPERPEGSRKPQDYRKPGNRKPNRR